MLAWMLGREVAIILVIALLAAGGSQLPKLVRAFGEGPAAPNPPVGTDGAPEGTPDPGPASPPST